METHIKTKVEIDGKPLAGFKELRLIQSHNQHHALELTTYLEVIEQDGQNNLMQGQRLVGQQITVTFTPETKSTQSHAIVTGKQIGRAHV